MKTFKNIMQAVGILAAAGALTATGALLQTGNLDPRAIAGAAAGGAIAALAAWLVRSPLAGKGESTR